MPINIFDRQFFGDLQQFDTTTAFTRTIIEPSVPVSDFISRVLALSRTITEPSVPASDSISRLLALSRNIIEPTVSILDSVVGTLGTIIEFIFTTRIKQSLDFFSRVKQSLSFTTRIKDKEDKSI